MSEALEKINQFEINMLDDLLCKCTEGQQELFWKMYGQYGDKVSDIPPEKRHWAIQQCENTLNDHV